MRCLAAFGAALLSIIVLGSSQLQARPPVMAKKAMVVSREPHATDAGVAVLRQGGNAVDAAVAVGLALAVTHPSAGNLGGGGFMLIRLADGRSTFLDFRERAPKAATHNMYLDANGKPTSASVDGWRAAGVPGTVKGLEYAAQKYGKMKWADLVAPAVDLARNGFPVPYGLADYLKHEKARLSASPDAKRIFLKDGALYEAGDVLVQPELTATLQRIAARGSSDVYSGETAHRLAQAMKENGGLITLDDLESYAAVERAPLTGSYRGFEILTAPPPSSGGTGILQMLGMLEGSGYEKAGAGAAATVHYMTEAMRRYYADRSEYLGDPDFVKIPVSALLSRDYVAHRKASISPDRATPSDAIKPGLPAGRERTETTHYSVVDAEGNAVAVTYTLNGGFGNGVVAPGLGFFLNNEMDDFSAKPGFPNMFGLVQGEANAIQAGKRPLSSMTPTIVLRNGKLFLVVGSPGGATIINTVLEVLVNVIDFGMNIRDAVDRPRFHHQWKPDELFLEPGFSPDTVALLQSRGHHIKPVASLGEVEAILIDNEWLQGAADSRVEGKAAGY